MAVDMGIGTGATSMTRMNCTMMVCGTGRKNDSAGIPPTPRKDC